MSDQIGTTEVRQEGFYWVILGHNPPEIAYWERGKIAALHYWPPGRS